MNSLMLLGNPDSSERQQSCVDLGQVNTALIGPIRIFNLNICLRRTSEGDVELYACECTYLMVALFQPWRFKCHQSSE